MDMREYINIPFKLSGANTITQKKSGDLLKLFGADADIFSLGDATHEGGDIKVYRNATGDLALSLDTDAASNALALSIYGGVVAQNYLSVGQTGLSTQYPLYISGNVRSSGFIISDSGFTCYVDDVGLRGGSFINMSSLISGDIPVSGTDSTDHLVRMQIDSNDIVVAQATGDGSGGITNKAVGLYGTTPATQAAHIADPAESIAANNAAIDAILVALENIGIIASA